MASLSFIFSGSPTVTHSLPFTFTSRASLSSPPFPNSRAVRFAGYPCHRKVRGLSVVTRAGPSTSSYVFAFALPLSLLAGTIFTSIRIADKLDADFLEEVLIDKIMGGFFVSTARRFV
ncbi:hypothetical protein L6164_017892 [Bauhinia variegata]|uniref:Uncharacterized protein n=1 Tax=Bauhinia variegata TaxID=167791 RepID=A0ACB9NA05_BAUVA|nr:hypothetical protein L6164_017892 [Bauhinia variegata]